MTPDRLRQSIEVEQKEPLIIRRDEEFLPFANIVIYIPSNDFPDWARQEFVIDDQIYGRLTGRFFFRRPNSGGNADIGIGFLPQRFYTLAGEEDDLTKISHDGYPGQPRERFTFALAVDLPTKLSVLQHGSWYNIEHTTDFIDRTRIKVTNHLTDKGFYASNENHDYEDDDPEKPNESTTVFNRFYYADQEPITEHQREAGLELFAIERMMEEEGQLTLNQVSTVEDYQRRRKFTEATNNARSYLEPFQLAFVKLPKVMEQIGITLETCEKQVVIEDEERKGLIPVIGPNDVA